MAKDDEERKVIRIGNTTIRKVTFRFKQVLFSDWSFQRHYRFQLLVLATLMVSSSLVGYSLSSLLIQFKPAHIGFQALLVGLLLVSIWKLRKEDEKLRRLDAMLHGLNTKHTTDKILGEQHE